MSPNPDALVDPLLTSLCAICHVQPPKYKCPSCALRTCSLPCVRKHKAWSSCSGARDPTAYMPPSKLRTPAGIDHDYNFLSSIERAVQRSEREVVEERRLVAESELRPPEVRSVQWRRLKDGTRRKTLVSETSSGSGHASQLEVPKQMKKRLATLDICLQRLPNGMSRRRENGTNVQKASGRINWQVEWVPLRSPAAGTDRIEQMRSKRILSKAIDNDTLRAAFMQAKRHDLEKVCNRRSQSPSATPQTGASPTGTPQASVQDAPVHSGQDPLTGCWRPGSDAFQSSRDTSWTPQDIPDWDFYLVSTPETNPGSGTAVHKIDPDTTLSEALRHTTIVEYPTFYVLPTLAPPPPIFQVIPKRAEKAKRKREEVAPGHHISGANRETCAKRSRIALEEGELDDAGSGATVSLTNRTRYRGGTEATRQGSVQQSSPGEDEAGGRMDDDTTSSSGSESESDDLGT